MKNLLSKSALGVISVFAVTAVTGAWVSLPEQDSPQVVVYKTKLCGCCHKWAAHLEQAGFDVVEKDVGYPELVQLKADLGVGEDLSSCHTAVVDGYVVEGHVPAADVRKLLAERPAVQGIAVPGMPIGSPGMEGPNPESYETLTFDGQGRTEVFARH